MAPEVMEQVEGYDYKADIWSFGITALELAKGFAPYAFHPPMKVLLLTIQEEPPSLRSYATEKSRTGESFSRSFKEMARMCLQKEARKRPTVQTLLNCKFFKMKWPVAPIVNELLCHICNISVLTVVQIIIRQEEALLQMPDDTNIACSLAENEVQIFLNSFRDAMVVAGCFTRRRQ